MRTKKLFIVIAFALISSLGFSQKLEYSGFFDSYYYKGKQNFNFTLNGTLGYGVTDLAKYQFAPSYGIGLNYKIWPRVMFGTEFHYLTLKSKDRVTSRNLAFTSTNLEFMIYGRYYWLDDIIRIAADRTKGPRFFKSYLMLGFGMTQSSASTTFTKPFPPTDSIYLYSEPSAGFIPVIPVALGLQWRLSNKLSIITELGYRKTFSDYIDGISLRGDPKNKDGYWTIDLKIQVSPFAKRKKKKINITPPDKYEGPKGTNTWKNRPKEEPVKKNNYYQQEEVPAEPEQQFDENGNPIETPPAEPQLDENGNPVEKPAPKKEEEPLPEGWN